MEAKGKQRLTTGTDCTLSFRVLQAGSQADFQMSISNFFSAGVKAGSYSLIGSPGLQFECFSDLSAAGLETVGRFPQVSCCGDFSEVRIKLSNFSMHSLGKDTFSSQFQPMNEKMKVSWRVAGKYSRKLEIFRIQSSVQVENLKRKSKTSEEMNSTRI